MSQFNNNNFGTMGPGSFDPVSAFAAPTAGRQRPHPNQPAPNASFPISSGIAQPHISLPMYSSGSQGFFDSVASGSRANTGPGRRSVPLTLPQRPIAPQYQNWDQSFANAMGNDMANQQNAMDQLYGQVAGQIGQYENALTRGVGTLGSVGAAQRQNLQGLAGGLEAQGRQGFDEFKSFRDQQMGAVNQDIARSNQLAGDATQNYQQAITNFQDTSAQDAANAAFGMRRSSQEQLTQINMLDASPAEKEALRQTLSNDVGTQVSQAVTGIYSNMNNTVASMQGNLSSLMGAQSQTAMAGGQLRGQMGTGFGAQTLDALRMNQQMSELGSNLRAMGEQAYASAMQQSVALELQGRTALAGMIQSNPRQFVSMFAGLTGFLAAATTPGLGQISVPNFGANA